MTRARAAVLAAVLGVVLGFGTVGVGAVGFGPGAMLPAAVAHEGTAVIALEESAPTASGLTVRVRVTWSNDGHAATDATVTAVLVPPTGTAGTPVALTAVDGDGRYGAAVAATPGDWTLRVTVVRPPGLLEQPVTVPKSAVLTTVAGTSTPVTAGTAPASSSTVTAPVVTVPATPAPSAPSTLAPAPSSTSNGWNLIAPLSVAGGVAVVAVAVVVVRRRGRAS